jgi:hypothetical protein
LSISGEIQDAHIIPDQFSNLGGLDGVLSESFFIMPHEQTGLVKISQPHSRPGHASLKTTERYLGIEQDLHDAPCDRLGLDLEKY